ncbi:MAG: hypothetical protein INF84_04590 [Roseomonas sp.]|nr:hypothetical protein [Roseomonas sp.]
MMGFDAPGMLAPAFLPEAFVSPQNIATLRLASAAFYSAASDTPARAYYEPRILDDIEIGQSAADALAVGGRVALTVSEIALADGDNFAADLARYGLADGRAVRVLSLPVVNARASDFGTSLASAAISQAGSFARAESSLITSRVAQQREMTFPAAYWTEAEALARAEKWRAVLEAGPRMLRVVTDRYLGQVEIGQIGRVTYPAFGFQNGFVGVVVGWRERLSARRVEITLWGAG